MQALKLPPPLQPGDTIAITCPSGYFPLSDAVFAKQALERWGFNVIMGKTVGSSYFYFSEKDELRLAELQRFLDDHEVKAIMMGRGGYGLSRIIDDIDFSGFQKHPKWLNGFSDITVLHSHVQQHCGIATLHGPMCNAFKETDPELPHLQSLRNAFIAEPINYPVPSSAYNIPGHARGQLVGGNLAILAHLCGSVSQLNTQGKILFIEEVGEYLYNIDRMMLTLKRAGMLEGLAGLICGGFTDIKDTERPFGQDVYELILDKIKAYHYPVCFDFPAGHQKVNFTLCLGDVYNMDITPNGVGVWQDWSAL
jgi:muramoyltetrapeptide carboxypeptidase